MLRHVRCALVAMPMLSRCALPRLAAVGALQQSSWQRHALECSSLCILPSLTATTSCAAQHHIKLAPELMCARPTFGSCRAAKLG